MVDLPTSPNNREERYLASIAGQSVEVPECPWNRKEAYLDAINGRVESLQDELETLENNPDVADIVDTYADLEAYDTSTLTDKDIIRVLNDETHDGNSTYYRYSTATGEFTYIGTTKQYTDFVGTDGTTAGEAGLVPAPAATDAGKFLKADGTWDDVGTPINVVQTTGTSTTDVMSQNATTSMVYADPETKRYIKISDPDISASTGVSVGNGRVLGFSGRQESILVGTGLIGTGSGTAGGLVLGQYASATGSRSIRIGNSRTSSVGGNTVKSVASGVDSTAIGDDCSARAAGAIAIGGYEAHATQNQTIALGSYSTASGINGSIAIGGGIAASEGTTASGNAAVSIGHSASASQFNSVAIGRGATSAHNGSVALGPLSSTTVAGQVQIGTVNTGIGYNNSNYRLLSGVYDGQSAHDAATVGQLTPAFTNAEFNSIFNTDLTEV